MDEIIKKTIDKINKDNSSSEMEYNEKFKEKIKKNLNNDVIDLVCTYVNPNDLEYKSYKTKAKKINNPFVKQFLEEDRLDVYNFFLNLETTRKNLPFLRNIIIISPTPLLLNEIYHNDTQIIIIPYHDLTDNLLFRHNNVLQYIKKIDFISPYFLYASQEQFIVKPIKKENFFVKKIPKISVHINSNQSINNLKQLEKQNTNKLFKEKLGEENRLEMENQMMMVRGDVLELCGKLFKRVEMVDYILLQGVIGLNLGLYENCDIESSGFYDYNVKSPWERFLKIKEKKVDFFCINNFNEKFYPHILLSHLINLGYLKKTKRRLKVRICGSMLYSVPRLERDCRKHGIDLGFIRKNDRGNIDKDVYLLGKDDRKVECIKIVAEKCDMIMNDVLFFCGYDGKEEMCGCGKIIFPEKYLEKIEGKTGVPYKRFLGMKDTLVKEGNITFREELKK